MCNATSSETRRNQAKHVLYEIEMFCKLAQYFESGAVDAAVRGVDREGIVVRNAMIEAFQLHARQLIEFLTHDPGRLDSHASHFTKGPWRPESPPAHEADWRRFSKRVMHLSLSRADFTDADMLVETRRIRRELGTSIERFLEAVDDERVCEAFVSRARAALRASEHPLGDVLGPASVSTTSAMVSTTAAVSYGGGTAIAM